MDVTIAITGVCWNLWSKHTLSGFEYRFDIGIKFDHKSKLRAFEFIHSLHWYRMLPRLPRWIDYGPIWISLDYIYTRRMTDVRSSTYCNRSISVQQESSTSRTHWSIHFFEFIAVCNLRHRSFITASCNCGFTRRHCITSQFLIFINWIIILSYFTELDYTHWPVCYLFAAVSHIFQHKLEEVKFNHDTIQQLIRIRE